MKRTPRLCCRAALALLLLLCLALSKLARGANFSDDFSEGLNTNYWSVYQSTPGLYSADATHGNVRFSRTSTPNPGGAQYIELVLNSALFNSPMFGDFSAEAGFTNAVVPGPGIDQAVFVAEFRDGTSFETVFDNESGTNVHVWDGSVHGLTPATGSAGTFEITRVGSTLTGSYNGSPIFSESNSAPLTYLFFFLQSSSTDDLCSVTLDHFSLNFPILHPFGGSPFDGADPVAGLTSSGPTLFGTTFAGGQPGNGTIFRLNTNGINYTNLYSFTALDSNGNNSDGANPSGRLIVSSNVLYGTAEAGGAGGAGTVFRINTDGSGLTNLYSFPITSYFTNSGIISANYDYGDQPEGGLTLSGNTLYGTTFAGGSPGFGTVFRVNPDGTGFTNLYSFSPLQYGSFGQTNGDGAYPIAGVVVSDATLYGTTSKGGFWGNGAVYRVNTDGTGFTNLYSFSFGAIRPSPSIRTNRDGANPNAALVLSGNTLYGTARAGGLSGSGTVFKINTDGTGFANLHSFSSLYFYPPIGSTNIDGGNPLGSLVVSGNTLYGTTSTGGSAAGGTVFQINTDGTGFETLKVFRGDTDGAIPDAGLVLADGSVYGTTTAGGIPNSTLVGQGTANSGTVFSLALISASAPPLGLNRVGASLVISWPSDAAGFRLQTNADLATTNWGDYAGGIATNGPTESVTIFPSAATLFFRLVSP